ncbi:MAG: hypothetical protein PW790_09405 [Parvibaculaceae bacterium]|nr:hypothetical protein [Parvibaculaceae bacterium]
MNLLSFLSADMGQWLNAGLSVVGAASAVAALTPTPKDDAIIGKLYSLLDFLALNIGYAKDRAPNKTNGKAGQ